MIYLMYYKLYSFRDQDSIVHIAQNIHRFLFTFTRSLFVIVHIAQNFIVILCLTFINHSFP